jgi:hypothetical protein
MELGLKVIEGVPEVGRVVAIPKGTKLHLGRHGFSQGIDLTLSSVAVSRHHCAVWSDEGGVWLEDLGSRNGVAVNEVPIPPSGPVALRPCDRLHVGEALLQVVFLGQADPAWLSWEGGIVGKLALGVLEWDWGEQGQVLHDALLDAGCTDPDLLAHCLNGCWNGMLCSLLSLLAGSESSPAPRYWPG